MNIFKKLGLVTSEEDNVPIPKKQANVINTTFAQQSTTPVLTTINSEDESTYGKIIQQALNKRDLPGSDFLEFYKVLKNYESVPLEDKKKYEMAFGGLLVLDSTVSKDKLISTSPIYLKALDEEQESFNHELDSFNETQIANKQKEIQKLTNDNLEMNKKIQDNITKIASLTTEVNQNTQKSMNKRQTFISIIEKEKNNINNIVNNIKTYL